MKLETSLLPKTEWWSFFQITIAGFVGHPLGSHSRSTGLPQAADWEVQGEYQPVQYHRVEGHTPVYQQPDRQEGPPVSAVPPQ